MGLRSANERRDKRFRSAVRLQLCGRLTAEGNEIGETTSSFICLCVHTLDLIHMLCNAMLCYATLCCAMLLCCVMLYYAILLCYIVGFVC